MRMKLLVWVSIASLLTSLCQAEDYGLSAKRIVEEVTQHNQPYFNLTLLDAIGARVSGSKEAEQAVLWAKSKMEAYGFDRITLDPVKVPQWSRGATERASFNRADTPKEKQELKVTALGGSIGTPSGGIEAPVVEVHSLAEVEKLGRAGIQGKIVFFNVAMDPRLKNTFDAYDLVYELRSKGAATASPYGAVATVLRSLSTLPDDDHPHTGILNYGTSPKIPSAALSTHAANLLSAQLKANPNLKLSLELSASKVTTVSSFNVIGELTGSELPNEVIIVGGHLDSWDLGRGDQDDGAGVVQSLEIVRALKTLGLKPKRTIRVVLFMSEEFGGIGAEQYEKKLLASSEKVILGLESDRGGFTPVGFNLHANSTVLQKVNSWKPFLQLAHASEIVATQSCGTDTETLGAAGIPEMEFVPDSTHYFDLHHSALDQLSAVVPADLNMGAAAMSVLAYLVSQEGL